MGLFSRLRTSEYARHSAILMTGTVISMLLQTVSFAWLGNYYNDMAMGLYQYLNTAYSILLIAATGRYELSVMLPEVDCDGYLLALLSAGMSVLFSCLLEAVVLIAQFVFGVNPDWFAFLPATLAVLGVYYSCNYWLNRQKCYVKLAVNRVLQGVLFVFFNISYALVLPDRRYGLILGYLSAQIVVMLILAVYMALDYRKYRIRFSFARLHELAVDYAKFPKYSVPAGIVNNLAMHLPVFLLGVLSGSGVVGQYTMMNKAGRAYHDNFRGSTRCVSSARVLRLCEKRRVPRGIPYNWKNACAGGACAVCSADARGGSGLFCDIRG